MTYRSLPGVKEECNSFSHGQTGEGFVVAKRRCNREKSKLFSGLSLVLNKEGFVTAQSSYFFIHTSCRSESSNISLVVLDKVSLCL